jgi:hypothetical protein
MRGMEAHRGIEDRSESEPEGKLQQRRYSQAPYGAQQRRQHGGSPVLAMRRRVGCIPDPPQKGHHQTTF